jgi:hypothetical protein
LYCCALQGVLGSVFVAAGGSIPTPTQPPIWPGCGLILKLEQLWLAAW